MQPAFKSPPGNPASYGSESEQLIGKQRCTHGAGDTAGHKDEACPPSQPQGADDRAITQTAQPFAGFGIGGRAG